MLTQVDEHSAVQHANDNLHSPTNGRDAEVLAIVLKDLSFALSEAASALQHTALLNNDPALRVEQGIDFYREVDNLKKCLISNALTHTNGNQKRAAQLLGIRLSTLNAMIKRLGIVIRHDGVLENESPQKRHTTDF